jgi:hypothetical protein
MKTYIGMVFRLKAEGMNLAKAVQSVAKAYCLTALEIERLTQLTTEG